MERVSPHIQTCRYIHTPSSFARQSLLYVQEAGHLKSRDRHISRRSHLESYLFFIVLSGSGTVSIQDTHFALRSGDHVFLDCRQPYFHESSQDDPWELLWVHFNGAAMDGYWKYFTGHQKSSFFSGRKKKILTDIPTVPSLNFRKSVPIWMNIIRKNSRLTNLPTGSILVNIICHVNLEKALVSPWETT